MFLGTTVSSINEDKHEHNYQNLSHQTCIYNLITRLLFNSKLHCFVFLYFVAFNQIFNTNYLTQIFNHLSTKFKSLL